MPVAVAASLKVRRVVLEERTIWMEAEGRARCAACPACRQRSDRVHGRYTRRLAGAPWRGYAVRFILTVRSFCCLNPACPRTTFTEDFGDAAARRSRWTPEARRYLQQVTDQVGAEAGARLASASGLAVSPDTLLRLRPVPATAQGDTAKDSPSPAPNGVFGAGSEGPLALEPSAASATPAAGSGGEESSDGTRAFMLAVWLRKWTGADVVVREQREAPVEASEQRAPSRTSGGRRRECVTDEGRGGKDAAGRTQPK